MRKILFAFLSVLALAGCTRPDAMEKAVCRMMECYPYAAMQDIYKSFYQDRFGAEHMISDTAAVQQYLLYELAVAAEDTVPNPYYEPAGAQGRCVRVYLRCVNEGLLSAGQLSDAFIRSAQPSEQPEQSWADEWAQIEQAAAAAGVSCSDEDRDLLRLAAQTNRAVHHSDAYRNAYHPHYRIVRRDIFENELKSFMKQ